MPLIQADVVDTSIHPYTIEEGEVYSLRHGSPNRDRLNDVAPRSVVPVNIGRLSQQLISLLERHFGG